MTRVWGIVLPTIDLTRLEREHKTLGFAAQISAEKTRRGT